MKRRHKIGILLAIAFCFLLPLHSAYIDYYILMEADFLSASPKFENADLDCLPFCKKQDFTASGGFSYPFWVATNLAKNFSFFYSQAALPQIETLVLRC